MNTINLTHDQMLALSYMVRHGWNSASRTGLSLRTYRALEARGLIRHVAGSGTSATWEVTEDGRMWATENV